MRQRQDHAAGNLIQALKANTQDHRLRFERHSGRLSLNAVRNRIGDDSKKSADLGERTVRALLRITDAKKQKLESAVKLWASLSYKSVLQRGFALVLDMEGKPVFMASTVEPGQQLTVEFADGRVQVREDSGPKQGSLF